MQFVQQYQDLDFALSAGIPESEVMQKFNLTAEDLAAVREFWLQGNNYEIEKILAARNPQEEVVEEEAPVVELLPEEKPTHGYRATPRNGYVFVKRLPPEHKGRLIIPKAYESESDQGFVDAIGDGVQGLEPGMLVMFDKFAETGMRFTLVDSEGDLVELIQMLECNITAKLERVEL